MTVVLVGDPTSHRRVMGPLAARRFDERVRRLPAAGDWLTIDDVAPGSVDDLVSVASMCHADDADRHATALRDALAPGGRLLFFEHGGHGVPYRLADALYSSSPFGCHVDRDVTGTLRRAGFLVTDLERTTMPSAVPLLRPWAHGVAVVRGS
ncbi:MAG TPA: hypothetical protein VEA78_13075 [Acidimicrobiales bacterium]|nr:hypothetical protein [Acidimicrobiales bacterium]